MNTSGEEEKAHLIMKLRGQGIRSNNVLSAIENIPRDFFVEKALHNHAWENVPLPIGEGQTISQPYIVAYMTDVLKVNNRSIVLEVGTGSGYQAAILSRLCRRVYSIERIKSLHMISNQRFQALGISNISTREGDGSKGWPEVSPFDNIIITCACKIVPKTLLEQLKISGKLIAPEISDDHKQFLVLYTKIDKGKFEKKCLEEVRFVPMI
mgnify:CR=1 FL=1|tara:strand:- start:813 stop:1442 length:630 start_codon:yes stop_codon:yes gene_type:complete